jgi:probable HAF family extracellular repeat protein
MRRILLVLALVLSACAHGSPVSAPPPSAPEAPAAAARTAAVVLPRYKVIDLGVPAGYATSAALALNNRNDVVGSAASPGSSSAAVLFRAGAPVVIAASSTAGVNPLNGENNIIPASIGINNAGDIAFTTIDSNNDRHAVVRHANGFTQTLSTGSSFQQTYAVAINHHGQVAGNWAGGGIQAALWDRDGTLHLLGYFPGGNLSQAYAINDQGLVVGWARDAGGHAHAALFRNGVVQDLGYLSSAGGPNAYANAINDAGSIVGTATVNASGSVVHAFFFDGQVHDLSPQQPNASTYATGINARGDIVGFDPVAGALLWRQQAQYNLNALIPPASGWTLVAAFAINERSDIVGEGSLNGVEHAFLLTHE